MLATFEWEPFSTLVLLMYWVITSGPEGYEVSFFFSQFPHVPPPPHPHFSFSLYTYIHLSLSDFLTMEMYHDGGPS